MDGPFSGFVLDPSKCRKLSIEEKRDLIRELSKWPENAPEKLQKWSRKDLLEILCAELGKERKYTGLTKQKLIENLFRIVLKKKSGEQTEEIESVQQPPPLNSQTPAKRQRKADNPSRLPVGTSQLLASNEDEVHTITHYCKNLVCRAALGAEDSFCKRCSCCICRKYDDNKDPSLWLVCSSETPMKEDSCGMSCHLECALKHEKAGILKTEQCVKLDGGYYCIFCGKVNDLLRCWRKQLLIAKDARRVDVLCYRVSLSDKILNCTEKYRSLHEIVDTAMKKLESEVGPLTGLPNVSRGIVNRLSVGAEVQRLCTLAVESLDTMLSSIQSTDPSPIQLPSFTPSNFIRFQDVSSTTLTVVLNLEDSVLPEELVGYSVWHRKADVVDYPTVATCALSRTVRSFFLKELTPGTEYMFKIITSSNVKDLGKWEVCVTTSSIISQDVSKSLVAEETSLKLHHDSPKNSSGLSNPSSEGDESNNTTAIRDLNKSPDSYMGDCEKPEVLDLEKSSDDTCKGTTSGTGTVTMGPEETPGHSVSALDEEPISAIQTDSHRDSTNSAENNQTSDVPKSENESNALNGNGMVIVPYQCMESSLPVTPCRLETSKEAAGRNGKPKPSSNGLDNGVMKPEREPLAGSSSKKRGGSICDEICTKDGLMEGEYEYCVKVIRWLECEGHIETNFRVKFLTWFSLRATPQERKVVSVYVDTLIEDPGSLAGQLVDSFSEAICSKRPPPVPIGFCMKLWH